MGQPFPGGVCDEGETAAYLKVGGEIVAVDLGSGAIRWRRAEEGKLLAASDRHVLVRRDTALEPVLELLDAASGGCERLLPASELPGLGALSPGDALEAAISETAAGTELSWRSEPRYRGGASPPADLERSGGLVGAASVGGGQIAAAAFRPPPPPRLEPLSGGPDTIAAARSASRRFALRHERGSIVLEARGADGKIEWTTNVGAVAPAEAGPLRP